MPQNPIQSDLLVTQIKAGPGITVTPSGGTGVVEISAGEGPSTSVPQQKYNLNSTAPTANNLNLVGADVSGGSTFTFLNLSAVLAAGATATLPTVAALVAALTAAGITPVAGMSFELDVLNTSSGNFAWTVTTNTGWTLHGTMTIAENTKRQFIVTLTSLTAAVLQSLGQVAVTGL